MTTRYKHTFSRQFSDAEKEKVLVHIKTLISKKVKADIYMNADELDFKVPFSLFGNWNLYAMVDKGLYKFVTADTLTYKIFHVKTFIVGLILMTILLIAAEEKLVILGMFTLLILFNWVTRTLRHKNLFDDIVKYADTLTGVSVTRAN